MYVGMIICVCIEFFLWLLLNFYLCFIDDFLFLLLKLCIVVYYIDCLISDVFFNCVWEWFLGLRFSFFIEFIFLGYSLYCYVMF